MKYIDYTWEIDGDKIILDEELNIDKLGWRGGDLFRVTNINGRAMLVKVQHPLEKMVLEEKFNLG